MKWSMFSKIILSFIILSWEEGALKRQQSQTTYRQIKKDQISIIHPHQSSLIFRHVHNILKSINTTAQCNHLKSVTKIDSLDQLYASQFDYTFSDQKYSGPL